MAHTYKDDETGIRFVFNSDFSGDAEIVEVGGRRVKVAAMSLVRFVAYNYVAPRRISAIEDAGADEVMGLKEDS